jgi:pilus assembly protein Flp/PilA
MTVVSGTNFTEAISSPQEHIMKMFGLLKELHNDESGQGMVEYILVVVFVALAAVAGMKTAAAYINNAFTTMGSKVSSTVGT